MTKYEADITIIGAGPVGLMSAYLSHKCGLSTVTLDKSTEPLQVGRADALNARTLQLLEIAGLFDELYSMGKLCNTSSVWANGKFLSRQSSWWEALEGCMHKHFLMLGQSYLENLLDKKLKTSGNPVRRSSEVETVEIFNDYCSTVLKNGEEIRSKYLIGADGSRSLVRNTLEIPFEIQRPQIIWAVIDGVIDTDFEKVPEIIVFQAETSDVAWIPREGKIDRFYVRMDTKDFTMAEAVAKINRAMAPHTLSFKQVTWFSQFSVKESVADRFFAKNRAFLAGDACHIHSVNGGQGLNTGLADAFNLIWKISMVENHGSNRSLLETYQAERKPVAKSVIETSGKLVRSTKYSSSGTHAEDYVKIVEQRAGNITGMGIRYGSTGCIGQRLFDFELNTENGPSRVYSELDYSKYTLLIFGNFDNSVEIPPYINVISVAKDSEGFEHYAQQAVLVRPDSYIAGIANLNNIKGLITELR